MQIAGTFNSSNGSLTAIINGGVYSIDKSHPNYKLILESYKTGNTEDFLELYTHKKSQDEILTKSYVANTGISLEGGKVLYNGKELHHSYGKRILEAQKEGFPIEPMVLFFNNLMLNPSARSVEELPDFLMNRNLPLTEDGCFLAYKSVNSRWYSKYAGDGSLVLISGKEVDGRIYNAVGEIIECERNQVDDDRSHECSKGLHVGGLSYSGPGGSYNDYGDRVIIVKINPKDVVSVPRDHNAQKVRVCKYIVLAEYEQPLSSSYEGVEKVEPTVDVLTTDKLKRIDEITFFYKGKNDYEYDRRYMIIEEVNSDHVYGIVLPNDRSYEEGNESRKFMFDNMKEISYYDSTMLYSSECEDGDSWDEDDEDDEDWDEDDEDNDYNYDPHY